MDYDGQKEIIYIQLTPTETYIQVTDNGLILESYVNDDINDFLSDLLGIELYNQGVIFNPDTLEFKVFLRQETLTGSETIEVLFFYSNKNLYFYAVSNNTDS